ncbi:sensor histidine kinase [Taibaiella lutea]|nr:two-component regulator propeller domain-containing protein [Taibaiella lutea]
MLFVSLSCFFSGVNAHLLTYKTISTDNGLPSNEIHYIMQDSKGYVWIGTKNGLCRWDSKNFEYFTVTDGLPNNEVLYLYEDSKGRIWISCFSAELCYFFNGSIHNTRNTSFLNRIKNYPGTMLTELNNELYYTSIDGKLNIFNFLTQKMTAYDKLGTLPTFSYLQYKGKIWGVQDVRIRDSLIAKNAKTLTWFKDSSYYTPYYYYPNLPRLDIVTRMDFKNREYAFQYGMDTPFYHAAFTDKDLQTAIYNDGKVLEIYKDHIIQKKDNYVLKVKYANRAHVFPINKNLYIGSTSGLLFCPQIPILEFNQDQNINNTARFIFRYANNTYVVNSEYQLINIDNQKQVNQLNENAVNLYNILYFKNKFYLTTSFDIFSLSNPNGIIEKYKNTNPLIVPNFKYITPSKKNNSFFVANGGRNGILFVDFKTNISKPLMVDIAMKVYSIYEDGQSRLWYSTTNKVYYTDEYYNGIKNSREFVLDPSNAVFCKSIQEDKRGNLFFTTNGGVFVYDGKHKYRIDRSNLLSDNECNKILIDTLRSCFWVATKDGLDRIGYFKENGGLKFKALSKFFASDGLRSDNINDILMDSNKLYIATDKGVNILDDINYRPDTMSIPVYIKLTAINAVADKGYDTIKTISLEHDRNNLTIGFSALYFLRRDRLKIKAYLYRNNNLVSQSEITGDKIDYYSLNDGDYKLILYAFDQDYRYLNGRSAPFEFTIKPPYYKTWWFILGSGLLIIVISTSLLLWSQNRRKKRALQQAELQAKLNESTLKSLQSQMNPHFVFNSLNTIQSFITEKNEEGAIDYLSDFSGLIREILEQSVHTFISLENEIQFLRHYVQLEITRFKSKFDVVWTIELDEDDLADIYIPTMLIQPIVENAVKHGVSSLNDIEGHIEISIDLVHDNLLRVVVKDNGRPVPHKKFKGNSIAVQTIKDRLNIYTKNKLKGEYHLVISETGATATITIPI